VLTSFSDTDSLDAPLENLAALVLTLDVDSRAGTSRTLTSTRPVGQTRKTEKGLPSLGQSSMHWWHLETLTLHLTNAVHGGVWHCAGHAHAECGGDGSASRRAARPHSVLRPAHEKGGRLCRQAELPL